MGFPDQFVRIVMSCVNSCSMQVLWNRKSTKTFWPNRGIRQGDPISPYLFVLAIKRLAHVTKTQVDDH